MTTNDKFTYKSELSGCEYPNCYFKVSRYSNNKNLYLGIESEEGPIAHCTCNLYINPLPDDRICIKNYSENQGMDSFLMQLGILDHLTGHLSNGYITLPVYTLSESGKELFKGI